MCAGASAGAYGHVFMFNETSSTASSSTVVAE
jgi:hypothetical protein